MAETRVAILLDNQGEGSVGVSAAVIRDFPPPRLEKVETTWKPMRKVVAQELAQADSGGEHGHWDWRRKISQADRYHLVAIECAGEIQGLMAILKKSRPASLGDKDERVLYVDYVEAAPWNLKRKSARPRFSGVGLVLIREAVAMSVEEGLQGRIGLHSLPQAEHFYASTCGMTSVGADPMYYDLVYFEFTSGQATHYLNKERTC